MVSVSRRLKHQYWQSLVLLLSLSCDASASACPGQACRQQNLDADDRSDSDPSKPTLNQPFLQPAPIAISLKPNLQLHSLPEELSRRILRDNSSSSRGYIHLPLVHKYSSLPGSSHRSASREGAVRGAMTREHGEMLRRHDRLRRGRLLAEAEVGGGAALGLSGNADPLVAGLYWATVGLGTPQTNYKVQIDTGSDVLWVQCQPCTSCATSSDLGDLAEPFSPEASSTASVVDCSQDICKSLQTTQSSLGETCPFAENDNKCYYRLVYGDRSITSGYAINDNMLYPSLAGVMTETPIYFGCSYFQEGGLLTGNQSVDGLMGLGGGPLSIVKQLTAQGVIADGFAHCLGGEEYGQGSLILGSVVVDGAAYTPLLPTNNGHYYVTLKGLTVGSTKMESITEETFGSSSSGQGVILDSGTTLALVPDSVYTALGEEIGAQVKAAYPTIYQFSLSDAQGQYCWDFTGLPLSDLTIVFPSFTLEFDSAVMQLTAFNYIIVLEYTQGATTGQVACFAWQPSSSKSLALSVLGDLVMRNKLVIYDLAGSQVGWSYMDCHDDAIMTQNMTLIMGKAGKVSSAMSLRPNLCTFSFWMPLIGPLALWLMGGSYMGPFWRL